MREKMECDSPFSKKHMVHYAYFIYNKLRYEIMKDISEMEV